ncbi:hypothetical protein [Jidongwangia harbinensis]|uniref:hypothetical protein n=1 Tax=Jidongwangia harbinensis TaxID=2878561 RepID=UPI001CD985FA|nr:hypothetical protein [Jidongwangia harbinensis]MCA2217745.1 hypothetical protein [Jidongwangia harbinensis]
MADRVARHLVAAGQIIDEDAELALQHAIAARRIASRIAVVREAVGLAAYAAGDWATAIAELRTYHRMTGRQTHLAEIADCERALGRPERAIDLFRGADRAALDQAGSLELLIVAAGARGDLGQHDAAVAMLQVPELSGNEEAEWTPRLRYAYADALLAAGRRDEAREWFSRAAAADQDGLTDAAERLLELDGITIDDGADDDDDEDADDETGGTEASGDEAGDATARRHGGTGDDLTEDGETEDGETDDDETGSEVAVALDEGDVAVEEPASADDHEDEDDETPYRTDAFIDDVESAPDVDEADADKADAGTGDTDAGDTDAADDSAGDEKAAGDEFVGAADVEDDERRPQA